VRGSGSRTVNVARGAAALAVALATVAAAASTGSLREMLRLEIKVQKNLQAAKVKSLQAHQSDLQEAWSRVDRLSSDLLRAEQEGESRESLRLRDQDLRQAEGALVMEILNCQQIRSEIATAQARIEEIEAELKRLEGREGRLADPVTGTWRVIIDPGGQEGVMHLELDGTLVRGTYQLEGDWSGSLRGTFVAGKVRLERIDSQLGFAAVYHGRLVGKKTLRLEGTWEGTHLASGMAGTGTWVATKVPEKEEPGYPEPGP